MTVEKGRATVLAVDDTPENIDVVKGVLSGDCDVKAAVNGPMALKVAQSQRPDLILLDIMMPGMDGYEVCRRLKADPATAEIPIIFLTAMDQTDDETEGFDLGAADYIRKPVNPAILMSRVKTHLALKRNVDALREAYALIERQNLRMGEELNVGRDIQMSMIPRTFPPFPGRDEFELHAVIEPAREVGGDFYDYFFVGDDRLCVCVGDVSGKGVPAALFMAVTRTLLRARAGEDHSAASIVTYVNDELSRDNPSTMFVTLFVAIVDVRTGAARYTNAGHNPPYLRERDGTVRALKDRHGPMLGVMPGLTYGESTLTLEPAELLFAFTDGVTEAMDRDRQLFSEARLEALLAGEAGADATAAVNGTLAAVLAFEEGTERSDDVTAVALRFDGSGAALALHEAVARIGNSLEELTRIAGMLDAFAREAGLEQGVVRSLNVVFDELLNNVISYGFDDDPAHFIEVRLQASPERLKVTVTDDGIPFNPLMQATPDTSLSIEERAVGGLGIHIVKNLMDEVDYHRSVDRNVMTLIKRLA